METPLRAPDGRVIAFIDIGTNSIRLLLVRINPNQSYSLLNQEKEVVRLGEGEFVDQHLQPVAMERAALVCATFTEMARAYDADEIIAIATSATREAENKGNFLRLLKARAGLDVRTVSGLEEARLIYLGLSSGLYLNDRQGLFIDIGGGSTEVIVGDQTQHHYLDSLKLGAIRLSTLFFLPEETGPVPPERYALLQQYVRNATIRTFQRVRQYRLDLTVGSSGTIENLADIAAYRFLERPRERDDVLKFDHLEKIVRMLRSLPYEERRRVPGLSQGRADIIVPGAAILHTIMQELELPEIAVSDRGLRDGLLVDYLLRSEHAHLVKGMSVRERSVLQLGRACGFEEAHARQVANIALMLFDSAENAGLHSLGEWERELLEYAALLHDIGTFLSHSNHQAHTYYLIHNADLLGFDQTEIAIIATVAYFHRKAYPRKKHPEYRRLDEAARALVRPLSVLLQMAESLDRSRAAVVRQVQLLPRDENKVALRVTADQDCQLEIWGIRNQMKPFKKVFGRKLVIEVEEINS
jgi:exopolyphosphatase/guanosine-5'-triphosphate,3'-diphosphate pyrophosphatase